MRRAEFRRIGRLEAGALPLRRGLKEAAGR